MSSLSDSQRDTLIESLRRALVEGGEHRLFKRGKWGGLFSNRTGSEVAEFAVEHHLVETVRTELRGETVIEWVRLTPGGIEYVHRHDSPKAMLAEIRRVLEQTAGGIPAWLTEFDDRIRDLGRTVTTTIEAVVGRLDTLTRRVEEAIRRAEMEPPSLPEQTAKMLPWGVAAMTYLDERAGTGVNGACPLPELFEALRRDRPELTVTEFQEGLRHMAELKAVALPEVGSEPIERPEFAMLHRGRLRYSVTH